MRWQYPIAGLVLVAAWAAWAGWQFHEYGHQYQQAHQSLVEQSDSLASALVGGVQSHRRLGRFFEDQIQGVLDGVASTDNVLAVVLSGADGGVLLSAGDVTLLENGTPREPGVHWEPQGLLRVERFELQASTAGPPPGRGRGWRWQQDPADDEGPLARGGAFEISLLLDRARADAQIGGAARLRIALALAGGLVLGCVAAVWAATVRLAAARGRTKLLESEARHLGELAQAAAGLAHETRNPLGLIRGWSQQLASGLDSPEQQDRARAVVEECDRLTSRINEFLSFARPRAPSCAPVDPAELVAELATLLQPDLEAKTLRLVAAATPPGADARAVWADREMLRQALFNLIQNAVQFAPEGTAVEIGVVRGHDGRCRFEVADRGPGVEADRVVALFVPYHTTRPDGTGLGLAIVRRIVAAHGGLAGYRPRSGGGSVFWMDLPTHAQR